VGAVATVLQPAQDLAGLAGVALRLAERLPELGVAVVGEIVLQVGELVFGAGGRGGAVAVARGGGKVVEDGGARAAEPGARGAARGEGEAGHRGGLRDA
jgi:hypothetical protein